MIQTPKYRTRTHDYLLEVLRKCMNKLDMRDWDLDLSTEETPPKELVDDDCSNACALVKYYIETLTGIIWICLARCKKDDCDPVFVLKHELGHIFLELHNEEWRCNKMAELL